MLLSHQSEFESANQLLANLALIAVSVWLVSRVKDTIFAVLPAGFMIVTIIGSLMYLLYTKYIPSANYILAWKNFAGYANGVQQTIKDPLPEK